MPAESAKKSTPRVRPGSNKPSARRRTAPARNGREAGADDRAPDRGEGWTGSRGLNGTAAAAPEVHCALAPMEEGALLLPTNVVAEVIEYVEPAPLPDTPKWFLGQIEWETRQVPVFSYAALLSGDAPAAAGPRARIVILKSLTDSARVPYLGIVIRDIPKLLNVQLSHLVHTGEERKSMGVFCQVTVHEEPAIIPDLERLTHLVTHAAYGALPITQVG